MQDMNDFEHYDTTMGRERRPQPPHQCEPWQMLEHDNGWLYCSACGARKIAKAPSSLPPKPEPAEAFRMHGGPHWEHDCDRCIFLGHRPGSGREWDLYWCPPNPLMSRGNLIARHGIMGDYVSGMDWIDREPMLAIAAILAMRTGHLSPSAIV